MYKNEKIITYIIGAITSIIFILIIASCQKEENKEYYEAIEVCINNKLKPNPTGFPIFSCGKE